MSKQKKLIIIDGIPGSGKTTTASRIFERLSAAHINTRCFLEQEENHPLLAPGLDYGSFDNEVATDLFIQALASRFSEFVQTCLNGPEEIIIIESVLFQDAISVAHLNGINRDKLLELCSVLLAILEPLNTALIYYYQMDVEKQWRFICSVRGNEWGPVSMHTDEDFKQAAEVWGISQSFVRAVIDQWEVPKLIIENSDYLWSEYNHRINEFVDRL
ncbi:P-loop NTPase family protein [Paenibacillus sp. BAC0078]